MSMTKRIAAAVFTSALVLVPMASPASAAGKGPAEPAGKIMAQQIKAEKTGKPSGEISILRIDWY